MEKREKEIHEIKETIEETIDIQGRLISAILFADDIAVIAEMKRKLQAILIRMYEVVSYFSMKINEQKTKVMRYSKVEKRDKMYQNRSS